MTVVVCGGRDYEDRERLEEVLDEVASWSVNGMTKLIEGGARGADMLARRWAAERGIPVVTERADWERWGRRAGPLRNQHMLDEYKPDQVVAFPGGRGTEDMVLRAMRARLNVWVVG